MRKSGRMAIQASSVTVAGMAFVAFPAGILPVVGGVGMTCRTVDSGMSAGLDVEPKGAMGIAPGILEMAFLAVPAGPVSGVREPRPAIIRLMADGTGGRPRCYPERLKITVAIPAFERPVRSHERKPRPVVVEVGGRPARLAMAGVAIAADRSLVVIGMTGCAIRNGFLEFLFGMAADASDVLVQAEQSLVRVPEFDFGERMPGRMTGDTVFFEFGAMGRGVTRPAIRLGFFFAVAGFATQFGVPPFQWKSRIDMALDVGRVRFGAGCDLDPACNGRGAGSAGSQDQQSGAKPAGQKKAEDCDSTSSPRKTFSGHYHSLTIFCHDNGNRRVRRSVRPLNPNHGTGRSPERVFSCPMRAKLPLPVGCAESSRSSSIFAGYGIGDRRGSCLNRP